MLSINFGVLFNSSALVEMKCYINLVAAFIPRKADLKM